MSNFQELRYTHGNEHAYFYANRELLFSFIPNRKLLAVFYRLLASKVLQEATSPLSRPRSNQRTRCADVPCVNESGTTTPRDCFCSASSPMALAAFKAD